MKMFLKSCLTSVCILAISLAPCFAEDIKITAGGAPADSIIKPITPHFEKATGDKINLIFGGATISFKIFDRGDSDVVFAGTSFDDLLAALKKEGYEVKDKSLYKPVIIGTSKLYISINKDNPVKSLTREQVKGIFTGKIQSWKEVGGNDDPIMVVISTQNPATMGAFKKLALDGEEYLKDTIDTPTFPEMSNAITSNTNAIGLGPYTIGDGNKLPQIPEYSRPVIAVTKLVTPARVQRLLDYIKGDGQKYVKP